MINAGTGTALERHFPAQKKAARGGHLQSARDYFGARFM
jgi:hypothetical protein